MGMRERSGLVMRPTSSPVRPHTTPGMASASLMSTFTMRACACTLRSSAT